MSPLNHSNTPRSRRSAGRALVGVLASAALVLGGCAAQPERQEAPGNELAERWADAWVAADADAMAALFTASGTYEDFAFQTKFTGPQEVAAWVGITHESIADLGVTVDEVITAPDRTVVRWTFSGQFKGAPSAFSVPVLTIIEISGEQISALADYYNRAAVLAQSGLPLDMVFE